MLNKVTMHTLGFVPSSAKIISIMFYVYSSNTFNKVMIYFLKKGISQSVTTTISFGIFIQTDMWRLTGRWKLYVWHPVEIHGQRREWGQWITTVFFMKKIIRNPL
jgi:hypothetical protein